jgi:hypothetical protein
MEYMEACYRAAEYQMPSVPVALIRSLPLDDPGDGQPWLDQTGGMTMAVSCGDRMMGEVEAGVFVVVTRETPDDDEVVIYDGPDRGAAWVALLGG